MSVCFSLSSVESETDSSSILSASLQTSYSASREGRSLRRTTQEEEGEGEVEPSTRPSSNTRRSSTSNQRHSADGSSSSATKVRISSPVYTSMKAELTAFFFVVFFPSEASQLHPSRRIPSPQSTTLSFSFLLNDDDNPPTPSNPSHHPNRTQKNRRRPTNRCQESRGNSLSRSSTRRAEATSLEPGKGSRRRRL